MGRGGVSGRMGREGGEAAAGRVLCGVLSGFSAFCPVVQVDAVGCRDGDGPEGGCAIGRGAFGPCGPVGIPLELTRVSHPGP